LRCCVLASTLSTTALGVTADHPNAARDHSVARATLGANGDVIVTEDVLLEHVRTRAPELAALPKTAWIDNGRRVLLSFATDAERTAAEMPGDDDSVADRYAIASVEVDSGDVAIIGSGHGPVAASHGDTLAYFASGSDGGQIVLARADGERLCSITDSNLMPNASGIQALALTADGKRLAFAVGFEGPKIQGRAPRTESEPAVRVLDTRAEEADSAFGTALWITDVHCRKPRRVADATRAYIGRLAWIDRVNSVIAVADTPVPGGGFPRTDLLLFDVRKGESRTFMSNIGGQAQNPSTGFLGASPSGDSIAFTYDEEALPYLRRRQLAVASLVDGRIHLVSGDPRDAAGWLDSRTLLVMKPGAHPLLSRAATLSLTGIEREIGAVPGHATPSRDGRKLAWIESDLYGNASLRIAGVGRADSQWMLGGKRVIWQATSRLGGYARGARQIVECQSSDAVRPAATLILPLRHAPELRYPLIVDIHGGPRGGLGDQWYPYSPGSVLNRSTLEHDLWAAKGYVVLVPDYRASGSYGFDKVPRDGSGFERDFDDIWCHVQALVDRGSVDPDRMAVVGHSYGGMEVNWIVTHSDRFKAAISKEGSFNVSLAVAWGSRGKSNQLYTALFGAPYEYPERYRRMSVMDATRGVTTPTLFVEHRGGRRAGDLYAWMFAAWQQQGVSAQLRLYDEERHVLRRPADMKDVLYASIAWIDEHLGVEPPAAATRELRSSRTHAVADDE
jgi:Prolyl oligopeptidase family